MLYKYLGGTLLCCILFLQCATRDKIGFDMPHGYTPAQEKEFSDAFYKGKVLFKANCAQCHGIYGKAKDSLIDFTDIQIDNYSARFMRHDPKNHAVAQEMSPEQMNEILLFLRHKRLKK